MNIDIDVKGETRLVQLCLAAVMLTNIKDMVAQAEAELDQFKKLISKIKELRQ